MKKRMNGRSLAVSIAAVKYLPPESTNCGKPLSAPPRGVDFAHAEARRHGEVKKLS
jgi:hypothetical protein